MFEAIRQASKRVITPSGAFLARYLLSVLLFNLAACASMRTVTIEDAMTYSPPRGVDYGSLVEVRTLDKREATFRVTEITPEGLGGKPGFFRYEDMKSLKVDRTPERQTDWTYVFFAVLGLAGLILVIDNADHVSVCSGLPCPQPDAH